LQTTDYQKSKKCASFRRLNQSKYFFRLAINLCNFAIPDFFWSFMKMDGSENRAEPDDLSLFLSFFPLA